VRLCLDEAKAAGTPFPAAEAACDALSSAMDRGHADDDFVSMLESFEELAGRRL
jgi:3-hydroxyisobutyrate dehydrogenase-like beta-hydroxyacid dehydrogenase